MGNPTPTARVIGSRIQASANQGIKSPDTKIDLMMDQRDVRRDLAKSMHLKHFLPKDEGPQ